MAPPQSGDELYVARSQNHPQASEADGGNDAGAKAANHSPRPLPPQARQGQRTEQREGENISEDETEQPHMREEMKNEEKKCAKGVKEGAKGPGGVVRCRHPTRSQEMR